MTSSAVDIILVGSLALRRRRYPGAFFTIPHFGGFAAVLIQLEKVSAHALREAVTDGWLAWQRDLGHLSSLADR
jgi:hypothetical protein